MRYKHVRANLAEKHDQVSGERLSFLATGADTDNRVSIYDSHLPKGNSAPAHYHERDDEIFYIVSGDVEFVVAEERFVAIAGDLVIAGPKVPRQFEALSDSHLIVVNAPGGPSEGFLRDVVSLSEAPTDNDKKRFIEMYGIHVL